MAAEKSRCESDASRKHTPEKVPWQSENMQERGQSPPETVVTVADRNDYAGCRTPFGLLFLKKSDGIE